MKNEIIYAIGDIHGQYEKLIKLIKKIGPELDALYIFIGDYIDRGYNSKKVINFLIKFSKKYNTVFLKGNHEELMMQTLAYQHASPNFLKRLAIWTANGGDMTIKSYGGIPQIYEEHKAFFENLRLYYETEKYLFVHAGIKPGIKLNKQNEHDLLWIRDEFLYSPEGYGDKLIIHGHTITSQQKSPFPNKIGIDTGACWDGPLTAIKLPEKRFIQAY